jgi:hypothetical protein
LRSTGRRMPSPGSYTSPWMRGMANSCQRLLCVLRRWNCTQAVLYRFWRGRGGVRGGVRGGDRGGMGALSLLDCATAARAPPRAPPALLALLGDDAPGTAR